MNRLTRQEQIVLCVVVALLLTGWAVKSYRTAHPPEINTTWIPAQSGDPAEH